MSFLPQIRPLPFFPPPKSLFSIHQSVKAVVRRARTCAPIPQNREGRNWCHTCTPIISIPPQQQHKKKPFLRNPSTNRNACWCNRADKDNDNRRHWGEGDIEEGGFIDPTLRGAEDHVFTISTPDCVPMSSWQWHDPTTTKHCRLDTFPGFGFAHPQSGSMEGRKPPGVLLAGRRPFRVCVCGLAELYHN